MCGKNIISVLLFGSIFLSCNNKNITNSATNIQGGLYKIQVNCAGPAIGDFQADQPYAPGSWGFTRGGQYWMTSIDTASPGSPPLQVINSMRYSCGASFHYKFDVPNGLYTVGMHFVSPMTVHRIFDVLINDKVVLEHFNPVPRDALISKQFDSIPVVNGLIDISFKANTDAPAISAIEITQTSKRVPPESVPLITKATGGLVRVELDKPSIWWSGTWTDNGGERFCNIPGNAVDFTFKGPVIRLIGSRAPDQGIAEVYINGNTKTTIDSYATKRMVNQILFEKKDLDTAGYHTIRIIVTPHKNQKATGNFASIMAFECREPFNAAEANTDAAFDEVTIIESGKKPFLSPSDWIPVTLPAIAPSAGVTLLEGDLLIAFHRNIEYQLRNWNMKDTWKGWFPDKGGPRPHVWTGWLPGSEDGRRLLGASHILKWSENPELKGLMDKLIMEIAERQRADGYALPYEDTELGKIVYGANNERAAYDRRFFTLGLIDAGIINPDSYSIARRFQDWLYKSPYISTMLDRGLGYQGAQPNLAMYFSPYGKPEDIINHERYFRQDWLLKQLSEHQPAAISRFPLNRPHSYFLTLLISYCDAYRATGDPRYKAAIEGAWKMYHDGYIHTGGSSAICEDGDNGYPYRSYYLTKHTGENCGGAFWIELNHRLLQLSPDDVRYADEIEKTLYNVTLANQDGRGCIRYHTNLVGKKERAGESCTCCEVTNTSLFGNLPELIYSIAKDGLYVNLFSPSRIVWKQDGKDLSLVTQTRFPRDGQVSMTLGSGTPIRSKLRIRIPSWVSGDVALAVNGKEIAKAKSGTYAVIDRTWSDKDIVSFNLNIGFRSTLYTGFNRDPNYDRYALEYGPLLMALIGSEDLDIPADKLTGILSPVAGSPLNFSVTGFPNCRYVPYWQIQEEQFTCFPTMR